MADTSSLFEAIIAQEAEKRYFLLIQTFENNLHTQSQNSVLSGRHCSPKQAAVVLSDRIEADDLLPKGLNLRNVDGNLWLRGYVCDSTYPFPGNDLFAFEKRTELTVRTIGDPGFRA